MAGHWSYEGVDGGLKLGGKQTWTRGAKIKGAIVLEDQTKRHTPGAVMDESFVYPFAGEGEPYMQTQRTIFVYGKDLPVSHGDAHYIRARG